MNLIEKPKDISPDTHYSYIVFKTLDRVIEAMGEGDAEKYARYIEALKVLLLPYTDEEFNEEYEKISKIRAKTYKEVIKKQTKILNLLVSLIPRTGLMPKPDLEDVFEHETV